MVSTTENETVAAEVEQIQTNEIRNISDEDFEKAQKTFQLGKKNLLLNKYAESVNNIEEACKIYSAKYGELDPNCAEIYYFFGRALLELARVENTVLGNALNGVPDDTGPIDDSRYGNPDEVEADEKDDIAEKVMDAMCTEEGENGKGGEEKEGEAAAKEAPKSEKPAEEAMDETKPETKEEEKKEVTASEESAEKKAETATEEKKEGEKEVETKKEGEKKEGEKNGGEEEEGDDDEEEEEGGAEEGEEEDISKNEGKEDADSDEISNLQRSWEMFELAKLIYKKNFAEDETFKSKRVAECLLKLGEISIEQEIYDQAMTDIKESIKLQEEQKEADRDERVLAESYYQLGLAQQFNNLFTEANEAYQKSINILQIRIEKLKGKLLKLNEATEETEDIKLEKNTINDEITELETLLPELNSKLEEVNEQGQQSLNLIKEAKEQFLAQNATSNGDFKPVNGDCKDITSLMKSKRKISSSEEISSIKKTRLSDAAANGTSTAENGGAENGTAAATETTTEENKIEVDEQPTTTEKKEEEPKPTEMTTEPTTVEATNGEKPAEETAPTKVTAEETTTETAEKTADTAEKTAESTPMAAEETTA